MDVLTYEEIREAERKEKEAQSLSTLSIEFIDRYNNYLADKRKVLMKGDDNFIANKLKEQSEKELSNARESFQRLFGLRAKKLVDQAFMDLKMGTNLDAKNLLDFEKSFYVSFKELLQEHINAVIKRKVKKEGESDTNIVNNANLVVRFVEDLPEFVWANNVLGPFKKEDVANLPKSVVELLLNKKVIEVV